MTLDNQLKVIKYSVYTLLALFYVFLIVMAITAPLGG